MAEMDTERTGVAGSTNVAGSADGAGSTNVAGSDPVQGLFADLTAEQAEAVRHTEGPLLVLAAAGSGKTRVITRRAAYQVLGCGIPPWEVLCITFTNKAAGEMRERIGQALSERQARAVTIGTFHALCVKLLRKYADQAGIKPEFAIFDAADQKRAMKQACKELDVSAQHFPPGQVLGTISNAKNQLIDAEGYAADATDFYSKTVARLYKKYQEILGRSDALDFDDLLLKMARLLQHNNEVRAELQQRYQYVQVDEYQDTNHAQFVIAHTLTAGHRNLCVVGDPDQSIYGWRGADLRNILDFQEHYRDARVIELGQNYRSTPQILQLADTLIRNNAKRIHKPLFTENAAGSNPQLLKAEDEEQEAERVTDFLRRQQAAGTPWGQMAVMYRVNALSRVLEDAMRRNGIPYIIARGTAFYQRKEVKDALAYMRLIANPDDEVSLLRVVNTPSRGIGDTTVEHVRAHAVAQGLSLWEAMRRAPSAGVLASRASNAVRAFVNMVEGWRSKVAGGEGRTLGFEPGIRDVVEMVIRDSGLEAYYQAEKTGDEQKLANLYELVTAAQQFDEEYGEEGVGLDQRLLDYLESVTLMSDQDATEDEAGGHVTLMTLHAAKGLEFDAVAMVGLEEGLLPHSRSMDEPHQLEEERRLCFVGITRAQRELMLSHARYRTIRGQRERTIPSQFLRELGTDLIEETDLTGAAGADPFGGFGLDEEEEAEPGAGGSGLGYSVGSRVRHPQFGEGKVLSLTPSSAPKRAKVHFDKAGAKTLVLAYARLTPVG